MSIGKSGMELVVNIKNLIDHSQCADMATNYQKNKFNHGNTCRLLHIFLEENASKEEIEELYPRGLLGGKK